MLDSLPADLSDTTRAHHAKNASLALRSNIARKISSHAQAHLKLLREQRERTDLSEAQAGQVIARMAIVKNMFVGNPCVAKGREHMRVALGWAVLAHNLWVLARREIARTEYKPSNPSNPAKPPPAPAKPSNAHEMVSHEGTNPRRSLLSLRLERPAIDAAEVVYVGVAHRNQRVGGGFASVSASAINQYGYLLDAG